MTLYQAVRARVLYFESFAIQALGGRVFSKYVAEFQILYPFIVKEIKVVTPFLVEIEMQPQNLS